MRRILLLAALALPTPLLAQAAAAPAAVTVAKEDLVRVVLDTAKGKIVLDIDRGRAPITTANFLAYVAAKGFDGESFYRAMPWDKSGLIQGGITSDGRKIRKPIAHEPTSKTGLHHVAGTISMARGAPGTAQSDFFILLEDMPGFDAGGEGGDADGYAAFGHVVEGMDVVRAIFDAPTDPAKGEGAMKGQMLAAPVRIVKASRVATPAN